MTSKFLFCLISANKDFTDFKRLYCCIPSVSASCLLSGLTKMSFYLLLCLLFLARITHSDHRAPCTAYKHTSSHEWPFCLTLSAKTPKDKEIFN